MWNHNNILKNTVCAIVLLLVSCNMDSDLGKPEGWTLTETRVSDNCNAYQMRFDKHSYFFRFAFSGRCDQITQDNYLRIYTEYLSSYQDSFKGSSGLILLDKIDALTSTSYVDSVVAITAQALGGAVKLYETTENDFTIQVSQ